MVGPLFHNINLYIEKKKSSLHCCIVQVLDALLCEYDKSVQVSRPIVTYWMRAYSNILNSLDSTNQEFMSWRRKYEQVSSRQKTKEGTASSEIAVAVLLKQGWLQQESDLSQMQTASTANFLDKPGHKLVLKFSSTNFMTQSLLF